MATGTVLNERGEGNTNLADGFGNSGRTAELFAHDIKDDIQALSRMLYAKVCADQLDEDVEAIARLLGGVADRAEVLRAHVEVLERNLRFPERLSVAETEAE